MAHNLEDKPRTSDIQITGDYTFNSLFLPQQILLGLNDSGFHRPSPIQLKAIPLGRCGLDLIVKAKSGTGKTLVFSVLALETVNVAISAPQVIILAPTREIAVQIKDVIKALGSHIEGLKVACFIGGLPIEDDIKNLKKCHIAIGAPGRITALINECYLKTTKIRLFVLDEADKLMEESFQSDVNFIYSKLPERKQMLAISATYADKLEAFLGHYMHSPTFVTPEIENPLLLGLQQYVSIVKEHRDIMKQMEIKNKELVRLLSEVSFTQCLVFFNFQTRAETLSHVLKQRGWNALYISGGQPQSQRLKVMDSLKKFECRILLTTDLTARGIDASNVNLVINYEVPFKTETYLHRMGRAGRYGSHGLCITIASENQEVSDLQRFLGQIGGLELSIPEVPSKLDNIWTCDVGDLKKLESIVVDEDSDLKESVIDIKCVSNKFDPKPCVTNKKEILENKGDSFIEADSEVLEDTNTIPMDQKSCDSFEQVMEESNTIACNNPTDDSRYEYVEYPWIPTDESTLLKPVGQNLLSEDLNNPAKKRNVSPEDAQLTLCKNVALYNSTQLLTSTDFNLIKILSKSICDYLNLLKEVTAKRQTEMEKFFQSYSCNDLLVNLAQHTKAWCEAESINKDLAVALPISKKENIFRISYDHITKNQMDWKEVLSDYHSSEEENDTECEEYIPSEEEYSDQEAMDQTEFSHTVEDISTNNSCENKSHYDYNNVPMFKELYNKCSHEFANYAGTFTDEASANAWYDNWRQKLSSVTNYVQQNIATYEMSAYQHNAYFNQN